MTDSVNDNKAQTLVVESKDASLITRVEYTLKHISCHLSEGANLEAFVDGVTDPRFVLPSGDKLLVQHEGMSVRFSRPTANEFCYEDVRLLMQIARVYLLIEQPFAQRLISEARHFYKVRYTLDNPCTDSVLKEITIRSGVHLYFVLPAPQSLQTYAEGKILKEMVQALERKEMSVEIAAGEDALHITGDAINREVIETVIHALQMQGLLREVDVLNLEEQILIRHIKAIAERELLVLDNSLTRDDMAAILPYREILEQLSETGQFFSLQPDQLAKLQSLYINRKEIYSLPLVIRIPLRSIYICFHEEISRGLQ